MKYILNSTLFPEILKGHFMHMKRQIRKSEVDTSSANCKRLNKRLSVNQDKNRKFDLQTRMVQVQKIETQQEIFLGR
jgi:hypothetical protein